VTSPTGGNVVEIRVVSKDMTKAGFDSAAAGATKLAKTVDGGGTGSVGAAVDSVTKKSKGLGSAFADVGKIAGGILVADLVQRGAAKVDQLVHTTMAAASNLNESLNAVDKTFGKSASVIHDWGDTNAAAFGLSTRAFNEAATPMGALLKNFGLTEQKDLNLFEIGCGAVLNVLLFEPRNNTIEQRDRPVPLEDGFGCFRRQRFVEITLLAGGDFEGENRFSSAALLRAGTVCLVGKEVLAGVEEERAEFAAIGIDAIEVTTLQDADEEVLCQILRFFRSVASTADIGVDGIPIVLA